MSHIQNTVYITKGPKGGCIEIFTCTFSTGTTIIDNSIFMKIFMNIIWYHSENVERGRGTSVISSANGSLKNLISLTTRIELKIYESV